MKRHLIRLPFPLLSFIEFVDASFLRVALDFIISLEFFNIFLRLNYKLAITILGRPGFSIVLAPCPGLLLAHACVSFIH